MFAQTPLFPIILKAGIIGTATPTKTGWRLTLPETEANKAAAEVVRGAGFGVSVKRYGVVNKYQIMEVRL